MAEPGPPNLPNLEQASGWVGLDVDDADGGRIGRATAVFADVVGGVPTWLIVSLGRRRSVKRIAVAVRECAAGGGRVWVAQRRGVLRDAPAVDPDRPLLREHELVICAHYGIGEAVGRAAEVSGREPGSVTSQRAPR